MMSSPYLEGKRVRLETPWKPNWLLIKDLSLPSAARYQLLFDRPCDGTMHGLIGLRRHPAPLIRDVPDFRDISSRIIAQA
jgi:hypothetical protein